MFVFLLIILGLGTIFKDLFPSFSTTPPQCRCARTCNECRKWVEFMKKRAGPSPGNDYYFDTQIGTWMKKGFVNPHHMDELPSKPVDKILSQPLGTIPMTCNYVDDPAQKVMIQNQVYTTTCFTLVMHLIQHKQPIPKYLCKRVPDGTSVVISDTLISRE